MGNVIVVVILVVIVALCLKSSMKHFKGEGSCCGGGGGCDVCASDKKKKIGAPIAQKTIQIEGMHCEHCKSSVESNINQIDGALAKVNLRKNQAVVSLDREVDDEVLIQAVEKAGFEVTGII